MRWLGVAARLRGRPDSALSRVHARMKAWASLTPQDRASARLQYVLARHADAAKLERSGNVLDQLPDRPMRRRPVVSRLVPVVPASVRVGPGSRGEARASRQHRVIHRSTAARFISVNLVCRRARGGRAGRMPGSRVSRRESCRALSHRAPCRAWCPAPGPVFRPLRAGRRPPLPRRD